MHQAVISVKVNKSIIDITGPAVDPQSGCAQIRSTADPDFVTVGCRVVMNWLLKVMGAVMPDRHE